MRPEVPQCDRHRRCVEVRDAGSVYRRVVKAAACQHGVIAHGQVLRLGGEPCAGPALVACGAVAPASSRRVPGWRRPAGTRFRTRRGARLRRPCVRESPNRGDPLRPPPTCPTDRCSRHGPKSRRAPVRDHRPPHASPVARGGPAFRRDPDYKSGANDRRPRPRARAGRPRAPACPGLREEAGDASQAARRGRSLRPTRSGVRTLRRLLEPDFRPSFIRSEAERRFLALVRRSKLPEPRVNARIHGHEVDFFWPQASLVVEVDGHAFHAAKPHERDSTRDQILTAHGHRVLRITWHHIDNEPEALVARVAAAIANGRRELG
jgi:very-short-patch-repair endonuclease